MGERSKSDGNHREQRQQRLADALRTNLRRRKQQERERAAGSVSGEAGRADRSKEGESG